MRNTKKIKSLSKSDLSKFRLLIPIVSAIIILLTIYIIFFRTTEPEWIKEGEVTFLKKESLEIITKIDVEVAVTPQERMQGLMYRSKMDENKGMLFIFEREELQSFWMKNTKISLDIIFIDSNGIINTIHRNTEPYSEESLRSKQPSRFVVEVNGGFCEKNHIKEGDLIEYRLLKH